MSTLVVDHPLVHHRVQQLRDEATDSPSFRRLASELAGFLAYEAAHTLPTDDVVVPTPLGVRAAGRRLRSPGPVVVPILRAGLGLLDGVLGAIPTAEVGVVGLRRDERTFAPERYVVKLPDLRGRDVIVLDPMLATGGSMVETCRIVDDMGAASITAICLIAATPGVERLAAECPSVDLVVAAIDHGLDERAFIVPGLGDAGDRLYGRP